MRLTGEGLKEGRGPQHNTDIPSFVKLEQGGSICETDFLLDKTAPPWYDVCMNVLKSFYKMNSIYNFHFVQPLCLNCFMQEMIDCCEQPFIKSEKEYLELITKANGGLFYLFA